MYYDDFGNRTQAAWQTAACPAPPAPGAAAPSPTATYNSANQVTNNFYQYDASGNVTYDGASWYAYDNEGRLCAVQTAISGSTVATGYLYDAEGRRVAKGSITVSSTTPLPSSMCNPATNGFAATESYVLGQAGEELTTYTWSGSQSTWARTNVYGDGLLATYDAIGGGLHFHLTDHLGTRRVQTDPSGTPETDCQSLPYGDGLNCFPPPGVPSTGASGDDATPLHFTGKERDTESGLDNFGPRYYGSNMGRFLSPDEPFVDQDPSNPQSWNLYSYVRNNPLTNTDDDGRSVNVCTDNGNGGQQCSLLSNDQYNAAQQAGNGSLNVPSLNSVGTNGSGSITDANGNSVGSATYVSDGGADYYANAAGYQQLAGASRVVNAAGAIEMGIMAPYAGAAVDCLSGGSKAGCAANMALSILPEVCELRAGATLLRAARGTAAAEILEKAGGFAQATKDFEALPGAEKTLGSVKVKELSDGSKAVLRNFSGDGRPTLEIQSASGTTKVRYN